MSNHCCFNDELLIKFKHYQKNEENFLLFGETLLKYNKTEILKVIVKKLTKVSVVIEIGVVTLLFFFEYLSAANSLFSLFFK